MILSRQLNSSLTELEEMQHNYLNQACRAILRTQG